MPAILRKSLPNLLASYSNILSHAVKELSKGTDGVHTTWWPPCLPYRHAYLQHSNGVYRVGGLLVPIHVGLDVCGPCQQSDYQ